MRAGAALSWALKGSVFCLIPYLGREHPRAPAVRGWSLADSAPATHKDGVFFRVKGATVWEVAEFIASGRGVL